MTSLPPPHVGPGLPASDLSRALSIESGTDTAAQTAVQRFLEPLARVAGAQAAAVRRLSPDGKRLQVMASCGLPEGVANSEHSVASDCGVCGAALSGQRPAWTDDMNHCAQRNAALYFGRGSRRILAVPLTHDGHAVGVATLFFADPLAIDAEMSALLESLGALIGLALASEVAERESLQVALASQRQALAAEVHDSVAQTLSFVKMRMPLLQEAIAAHEADKALRYCDDLRKAVGGAHTNLRQLLTEFRVPMAPQGLKHALQSSILVFSQRAQVALDFDDQAPDLRLSAIQESQVFHIVQEALANVAKHASARHAWLRIAQAGGRVDVVIEDDGSGPAADAVTARANHFGVDIMRERAARLGGHIVFGPRTGGGMRVHLSFPLAVNPAATH